MISYEELRITIDQRLADLTAHGGDSFRTEMVDLLYETATEHLAAAQAAMERRDLSTLRESIHSLASSVAIFGITPILQLIHSIERLAETGHVQSIPPLLDNVSEVLHWALDYMKGNGTNSG